MSGTKGSNLLIHLIRAYVFCIALFGFLFGQLFTGAFSIGASVAGTSGVLSASLGWLSDRGLTRHIVVLCSALGAAATLVRAYNYYAAATVPGGYYAWFLEMPFLAGLLAIGYSAIAKPQGRKGME